MNDNNEFEDILKSKFAEQEFPFDEENWEAAEDMISSYRRKEKIRKGAFVFFSGLAVGIVCMLPFVINQTDTSAKLISKADKHFIQSDIIATTKQSEAVHADSKLTTGAALTSSLSYNGNQAEGRGNMDQQSAENAYVVGEDTKISKKRQKPVLNRKNSALKNTNISAVSNAELVATATEKAKTGESVTKQETHGLISTDKNTPGIINKLKDSLTVKADSAIVASIKDTLALAKDTAKAVATASTTNPVQGNGVSNMAWTLSAYAGSNFTTMFSINPILGLELTKPISSNLSIGVGTYYTYLTIGSGATKNIVTNTTYDFGYTSDITSIQTNKLHYIVAPVFIQYRYNEKNTFIAGANNYMLVTVSNVYTTYQQIDGEKVNSVSQKTYGYSSGINSYDVGLLIGYKRNLSANVGLAVYINYGLTSIKKNDYYNNIGSDRNISGQLMLSYKIH